MTYRIFTFLLLLSLLILSCNSKDEKIPTEMENPQNKKIVVYQLLTRLFGNRNATNKVYGSIQENGVGKFNDINDTVLVEIKKLGITHVWYTGILEHATTTDYSAFGIKKDDPDVIKGKAGSPYAIKDYYDVAPDLAVDVNKRMQEFENLIARTHKQNLKVIVDFIPNHVARSYQSDKKPAGVKDLGEDDDQTKAFSANNNFYYLPDESFKVPEESAAIAKTFFPEKDGRFQESPAKVTGNDQFTASPGVNEWFETIKLNYGVDILNNRTNYFDPIPNTWEKMRDILIFWANKNVDGFRCDVAEMVPVEFWNWVIPQVKKINPEILFIAEIYNPDAYRKYIATGGFDYLYEKVLLYDTLRLLIDKKRNTSDIPQIQERLSGVTQHMLHFLENHDEQRIASEFFAGNPFRAIPAMTISATIDQGPVMIYFGQEVGEPGKGAEGFGGDDGRTTIFDYWAAPEHQKWFNDGKCNDSLLSQGQKDLRNYYKTLLNFAQSNQAIVSGKYADITQYNIEKANFGNDVHAFVRYTENEKLLIVNSFNDVPMQIKIAIPESLRTELADFKQGKFKDAFNAQTEIQLSDFQTTIQLKPYTSFIFILQQ